MRAQCDSLVQYNCGQKNEIIYCITHRGIMQNETNKYAWDIGGQTEI